VGWLDESALRIGLGCMRLPDDGETTIAAAVEAGITVFDTARAYGENERMVARALRGSSDTRIVTKGGMARPGGAWVADGRAKTIRADCEASLDALEGLPIDLYLLHAPDPRTPWRTSVRALTRLVDEGLVANVGVSNVNLPQLEEALELAPITAVQVALSPFDLRALRGGIVERCEERGITLIAHSPLGGPQRAKRLANRAEAALAWLLRLSPAIVAIPGATRPETARSAARAASLLLGERAAAALDREFDRPETPKRAAAREDGEVVVVMGIPGAGKTRIAQEYVGRGYLRLNRDERGGSLRELAAALDEALASGTRRVVLDNTYLTRASRSYVIEAANRHGVAARCVWLETPLAQAQVNLVQRILDRVGALPTPEELRALTREAGIHAPTSQMRTVRELEPPSADEGFAAVESIPFVRATTGGHAGVFVAAGARWEDAPVEPGAPALLFEWKPNGKVEDLAAEAARLAAHVSGPVETAICPHPGGPPTCWCRPPLPGLPLAFARVHGVDPSRSLLVGTGPAHRTLANTLGAQFVTFE
jgi:aryl-alcohol dehydrogenase-like predicted oxidoreductase/predicted kinase